MRQAHQHIAVRLVHGPSGTISRSVAARSMVLTFRIQIVQIRSHVNFGGVHSSQGGPGGVIKHELSLVPYDPAWGDPHGPEILWDNPA